MEDNQQTKSISVVAMEEGSITTKTKPKVTVDWAKNFGGEFNDEGFGVDVDKQGNIYVTGSFADSADFGDDISVNSEKNSIAGFVAKLDRSGKVLWVQKVDSASSDEGFGIDVDEAGNSYVTGNFKFDFTFEAPILPKGNDDLPKVLAETVQDEENTEDTSTILDNSDTPSEIPITIKSIGSKDVFVAKLDSDGKVKWANNFGGDSLDAGESIAVDNNGNSYITGSFYDTANFGSDFNFTSDGARNSFVTKLDDKGKVEWAKNFGGEFSDRGYGIAVDESGNTYVTGSFTGDVDFDGESLQSNGDNEDIFITKIDETGDVKWAQRFGGTSDDRGYNIAVDKAGNAYITGFFRRSVAFGDITLKSNGSRPDGFVAKLDSEGNVKWAKKFGGSSYDESFGISLDESENIYLTGSFEQEITFGDTTLTSAGDRDGFIAKLDKMGMVKWAKKLGSNSFDEGYDIAVKGDNETYVTGSFSAGASIDNTNLNNAGERDAFVVKLVEETPEISLAVTPLNITEDGDDKLTYTFTRTGDTKDPLTVNFMVGGDAVYKQDYTQTGADSFSSTEGMITFDGGEPTATITIDATDDQTIEEDETINLTLVAVKNHQEGENKDEDKNEDKETPELEVAKVADDEVKPEDVGKLMQSTVSNYKIATVSTVMAKIINDDTTTDSGNNSGGGTNSGGSNNSGGGTNSGSGNNSGGGSNSVNGNNSGGGIGSNRNFATKISNTNKTFSLDGDSAKIKFLLKKGTGNSVNEIALFEVEDEQGTINGVRPDDSNYAEVASQNATTVFSVLKDSPKGFSGNLDRIIELDNGKFFRLLMVKDGTLDALRSGSISVSQIRLSNSLTVSDVSDSNFDLGFSEDGEGDEDITVQMQLDNQAEKPIGTNLQSQKEGEVFDLRAITTKQTATFTVNREATFDNFVGFYQVTDGEGGIDTDNNGSADLLPGQDGYATAAVNNRVAGIDLSVANEGTAEITGEFEPGSIFSPFIIVNGTPDQLLDSDPNNDPEIYFPYIAANSDGVDHMRMLGDNIIGFEDLAQGGDRDFNDIIASVKFG